MTWNSPDSFLDKYFCGDVSCSSVYGKLGRSSAKRIHWVSFSRRNVSAQRPRPYCQKLRSPDVNILVSHKTLHRSNHNGQPHNISDPKLGSSEIFQFERSSHGFQYKAPGVDNDLNVLAYSWICLCMQLAYFTFLTVHKDADSQEDRDVPRCRQCVFLGITIAIA